MYDVGRGPRLQASHLFTSGRAFWQISFDHSSPSLESKIPAISLRFGAAQDDPAASSEKSAKGKTSVAPLRPPWLTVRLFASPASHWDIALTPTRRSRLSLGFQDSEIPPTGANSESSCSQSETQALVAWAGRRPRCRRRECSGAMQCIIPMPANSVRTPES